MNWVDLYGLAGCPKHVRDFFKDLGRPLDDLAERLRVDPTAIKALSSYESGWYNAHNRALKNPFGLTKAGGRNLRFGSVEEAVNYFEQKIGPKISDARNIDEFIEKLQTPPKYNSINPNYEKNLRDQYKTVQKYEGQCGCE